MKIIHCNTYQNGRFEKRDIQIEGSKFSKDQRSEEEEIIDAAGLYAIPGLIDIHFHGCAGVDFCDGTKNAIQTMAEYEIQNGITTIHPATMTLSEEQLMKIGAAAKEYVEEQREMMGQDTIAKHVWRADLAGIYMEGPFVSMEKRGAQNPAYIQEPNVAMFHRLQEASGNLYRVCAVAPETEGAMEFIRTVKDEVRLSIAHTAADYDTSRAAFEEGVSQVTHLFNAMLSFTHRAPGVVGAASEQEKVFAELICDGVHIHPSMIRAVFKLFGNKRIILISDSMMAAGMPDGSYELGGQEVMVQGNRATLADGTIAGAVTNLYKCLQFVVKQVGFPLEQVIPCVTENPAKSIGIWEKTGSIEEGKDADLLLVDPKLNLKAVILKGKRVR